MYHKRLEDVGLRLGKASVNLVIKHNGRFALLIKQTEFATSAQCNETTLFACLNDTVRDSKTLSLTLYFSGNTWGRVMKLEAFTYIH
jgi:hypothetical protein